MSSTVIEDLKDRRVPPALYWNTEKVTEWLIELGLPQYKECFETNFIDGKRLIDVTASHLPDVGVTDFDHIKLITSSIRSLMQLEEPYWNRSVAIPPRNDLGMYLEKKSATGQLASSLTYQLWIDNNPEIMWQPPMNNHCQLLPRS